MTEDMESIALVIVLFNPDDADKENLVHLSGIYNGVVFDNSEKASFHDGTIGKMFYLHEGANVGIAEAQNKGLTLLLKNKKISHFVFLDQDSRTEDDYPKVIVGKYEEIKRAIPNLSMLGPLVRRKTNGAEYGSIFHKYEMVHNLLIVHREIISSGSCVCREVLNDVGLNDGKLFIDDVDSEWCWRANAKGYVCGMTPDVFITHKVGCRELSIGKYKVIISSPFRYFYQYRNYLWLVRRNYVPLQWKFAFGCKYFMRLIYFPIFVKDGRKCFKYMVSGIKQGLLNSPRQIP